MKTLEEAYQSAVQREVKEALEFGLPLDVATKIAPRMAEIRHDPRGFRAALVDLEPGIAVRLGLVTKQ